MPSSRPERLAQVGELDGAPAQPYLHRVAVARGSMPAGAAGAAARAGAVTDAARSGAAAAGRPRRSAPRTPMYSSSAPHARAAQEQPAAAHVAPAHEVGGEAQALAEGGQQRVEVLAGGDAAEQHHVAARPQRRPRAGARRAAAAPRSARCRSRCPPRRSGAAARRPPAPPAGTSPSRGRDHEHAVAPRRRPREGLRVGQLAPEVEAAEEGEHFAERRAGRPRAAAPPGRSAPRGSKTRRARSPPQCAGESRKTRRLTAAPPAPPRARTPPRRAC